MSILCNISQSNPKGAAHARSGNSFRGGVSPRFTRRLKGQSTIEYVLVIAIIGLVIVFAGPGLAGAIRNQFNTVTGILGNGIAGGTWEPSGSGNGNGALTDADIVDPVHGMAFAVYSADDHSLMFYKRKGLPKVGDMFNSRRVTDVYTEFETARYSATWDAEHTSENNGPTNAPWYGHHSEIESACVVDFGIKPHSLSFWFQSFTAMKSVDLKRLNVSACVNWQHTFWYCQSLTALDLSGMNVTKLYIIESMCTGCYSLRNVSFAGWKGSPISTGFMFSYCFNLDSINFGNMDFSRITNVQRMFFNCRSLTLDCSDWNVPVSANHKEFNYKAPGVIAPKVWTAK
jgi:Flp pilus assembly pilin Flp